MNVRDTFRNLIKNQFLPDFDYNTKLSFRTVFFRTEYSYKTCECAFEHEFLLYISECNRIDENMCNRILPNILRGRCTHTDDVDERYIRGTSVSAIHIATALDNRQAVETYLDNYTTLKSGIFRLHPYSIALLKENIRIVNMFVSKAYSIGRFDNSFVNLYHCRRINIGQFQIRSYSIPEFCVRKGKAGTALLQIVLLSGVNFAGYINKALEFAITHCLSDSQKLLVEYLSRPALFKLQDNSGVNMSAYITTAIVFNQLDMLSEITKKISSPVDCSKMEEICLMLKRDDCVKILKKIPKNFKKTKRKLCWIKYVGDVLEYLKDYILPRNEVMECIHDSEKHAEYSSAQVPVYNHTEVLKKLKSVWFGHYEIQELFCRLINSDSYFNSSFNSMLYVLLELGADIDTIDKTGKTVLLKLFTCENGEFYNFETIMDLLTAVKIILQQNPSIGLNRNAANIAIELDSYLENKVMDKLYDDLSGDYIIDTGRQAVVLKPAGDGAVRYIGPVLIYCGFPATTQTLEAAFERSLPSEEQEYLRQCLEFPRALKLRCRDILRKHFRGRQIHAFMNAVDVPQRIKDFILLNDIFEN